MKRIFLVIGSEYESSSVLAAFEAKKEADAFANLCRDYEAGDRPQSPDTIEDTPENDRAHELYWKRFQRWEKRHPGGPSAHYYDIFSVQPIRLREPARSAPTASGL